MSEHDNEPRGRGNKPVEILRDGALKISIFHNRGEAGDHFAMVPGRTYTDKETGEVRESTSLGGSEPLRMAHLLTCGYQRVQFLREYARDIERASKEEVSKSRSAERPARSRDEGRER